MNINKLKEIYSDLTNSKITIDQNLVNEIEACLDEKGIAKFSYVKSLIQNQAFMEMDQHDLKQHVKSAISKYAFSPIISEYEFFNEFKTVIGYMVSKKIARNSMDRDKYQKNFKDFVSRSLKTNSQASKYIVNFSIKFWEFLDNNVEVNEFLKEVN